MEAAKAQIYFDIIMQTHFYIAFMSHEKIMIFFTEANIKTIDFGDW